MKLTRKLIPAFAMLLIAAVMMSTASFAWFSIRTDVTATGMSVTAIVPASLEISADDASWDYTADLDAEITDKADRLHPITYFKEDGKWYVPSATNIISVDGIETHEISASTISAGYWKEIALDYSNGEADGVPYALVDKLYLRTNAGTVTEDEVDPIYVVATAAKSGGSALEDGVTVYISDASRVYNISKDEPEAPVGGWKAPLDGVLELTVLIVYDGTNDVIKNENADLTATNITISFNKKA